MTGSDKAARDSIFRQEALDHSRSGANRLGGLLRITPTWMTHAYRLLMSFTIAALVYLCVGRIGEYAEGVAVVRAVQPAPAPGPRGEFPHGAREAFTLIVIAPGQFLPQLRVGQTARFEIADYPHAYESVVLDRVAAGIIARGEAELILGSAVAGTGLADRGGAVAEARLERAYFVANGVRYPLVDGLRGTVRIKVDSLPIIAGLLPGLRHLFREADDGFAR